MNKTRIEWADFTWNPVIGCLGYCEYCYARRMAKRFGWDWSPHWSEKNFNRPFPNKPARIFVNSMSDPMFWKNEWWAWVMERMFYYPQHTFMFLTKHPGCYLDYSHYEKNIWLGVTVTNQKDADERIPSLLRSRAAVKFVSIEPMMGLVDISAHLSCKGCGTRTRKNLPPGARDCCPDGGPMIDWVIVGGMTGPGAVPMHPFWVRTVRDQCKAAGVPFFFKSWGEYAEFVVNGRDGFTSAHFWFDPNGVAWHQSDAPSHDCVCLKRVGKKHSGDLIDGVQYHELPGGI